MKRTGLYVRSTCAYGLMFLNAAVLALHLLLTLKHARLERRLLAQARFARWNRNILSVVCGLKCVVRREGPMPTESCVILSNHQSAYETMVFPSFLPPYVWVLKESLTRFPFYGAALKCLLPIAIDRARPRQALKQVLADGEMRLRSGIGVLVFPEGTRFRPGDPGKFRSSGAMLARRAHAPILPVAHNAGKFWGAYDYLIHPGTVEIRVGEPFSAESLARFGPEEIMRRVSGRIDSMLSDAYNSR